MRSEVAGKSRLLLSEGRTLLRYLGEAEPRSLQLRLYARTLRDDEPLRLPGLFHACPALLRLAEPIGGKGALHFRLYIATLLLDVSARGARRLYDDRGRSRVVAVAAMAATLLVETVLMPLRLVFGRRWRR